MKIATGKPGRSVTITSAWPTSPAALRGEDVGSVDLPQKRGRPRGDLELRQQQRAASIERRAGIARRGHAREVTRGEQMRQSRLGETGRREIERRHVRDAALRRARACAALSHERRPSHRFCPRDARGVDLAAPSQPGTDRSDGLGRRDDREHLELDDVSPARRPLLEQRGILALHDLKTAPKIPGNPARHVPKPSGAIRPCSRKRRYTGTGSPFRKCSTTMYCTQPSK